MSELRRARGLAALVVLGLVVAGCGQRAASVTPVTSSVPGASTEAPSSAAPSASPSSGGIEHPTGASDVLLGMGLEGGFLPMELIAARLPSLTLYGDGSLIVAPPENLADPTAPKPPLVKATLSEDEVQAILDTALTKGGLAIAREAYLENAIMDAPTTVFEIHAGGLDKVVRVAALGIDPPQPGPDDLARRNFDELRIYLESVAARAADSGHDWTPEAFTGVLIQLEPGQQGSSEPRTWPWQDLAPADFVAPEVEPDSTVVVFPEHTLTPVHVAAVDAKDAIGGIGGITLEAADGTRYSLVIRPRLPG
jgi:hypothetical protein